MDLGHSHKKNDPYEEELRAITHETVVATVPSSATEYDRGQPEYPDYYGKTSSRNRQFHSVQEDCLGNQDCSGILFPKITPITEKNIYESDENYSNPNRKASDSEEYNDEDEIVDDPMENEGIINTKRKYRNKELTPLEREKESEIMNSVDPKADEDLLELIVKIAENPKRWQQVHDTLQKLDQDLITSRSVIENVGMLERPKQTKKTPHETNEHRQQTKNDDRRKASLESSFMQLYELLDNITGTIVGMRLLNADNKKLETELEMASKEINDTGGDQMFNETHSYTDWKGNSETTADNRRLHESSSVIGEENNRSNFKNMKDVINFSGYTTRRPGIVPSFSESNIFSVTNGEERSREPNAFPEKLSKPQYFGNEKTVGSTKESILDKQVESVRDNKPSSRRTEESQRDAAKEHDKTSDEIVVDNWSEMVNNRNMKMNEQFDKVWMETIDLLMQYRNDTSKLAKLFENFPDPNKDIKRRFFQSVDSLKHGSAEEPLSHWPGLGTDTDLENLYIKYAGNRNSLSQLSKDDDYLDRLAENQNEIHSLPHNMDDNYIDKEWSQNKIESQSQSENNNKEMQNDIHTLDDAQYLQNLSSDNRKPDLSKFEESKNKYLSHFMAQTNTTFGAKAYKNESEKEWPKPTGKNKPKIPADDHHANHSKWLNFSYHRVTTSPHILPRHRNAYVAVSVVTPTERNKTVKNWTNSHKDPPQGKPEEDILEEQLIDLAARPWSHSRHLDKMKEQLKSLSAMEQKLRYHWLEKQRLHEMLRDGGKERSGFYRPARDSSTSSPQMVTPVPTAASH